MLGESAELLVKEVSNNGMMKRDGRGEGKKKEKGRWERRGKMRGTCSHAISITCCEGTRRGRAGDCGACLLPVLPPPPPAPPPPALALLPAHLQVCILLVSSASRGGPRTHLHVPSCAITVVVRIVFGVLQLSCLGEVSGGGERKRGEGERGGRERVERARGEREGDRGKRYTRSFYSLWRELVGLLDGLYLLCLDEVEGFQHVKQLIEIRPGKYI